MLIKIAAATIIALFTIIVSYFLYKRNKLRKISKDEQPKNLGGRIIDNFILIFPPIGIVAIIAVFLV